MGQLAANFHLCASIARSLMLFFVPFTNGLDGCGRMVLSSFSQRSTHHLTKCFANLVRSKKLPTLDKVGEGSRAYYPLAPVSFALLHHGRGLFTRV